MSSIAKKIRQLREINTLYPYLMQRGMVKVKSLLKLAPLYPYENKYLLDISTQRIIDQLQQSIPNHWRGDNPAFDKNWKSIQEREANAKLIAQKIKNVMGVSIHTDVQWLQGLEERGYRQLEHKNFGTAKADAIVDYLNQQPVYPAHVAHFSVEKAASKEIIKKKQPFGSYDLQTIVKTPSIAEVLSDPEVIGAVHSYFGCLPTISSVNLFWAFAGRDGKARGPQRFHRDVDDYKTCTMFINLTDTKVDDGAHCYIEKTHTLKQLQSIFDASKNNSLPDDLNPYQRPLQAEDLFQLPLNGYSFDKIYEHFLKEHMVNLYGERGMVLITDNYGIHRGLPPKDHDRLVLWVSFALTATNAQAAQVKLQQRCAYSKVQHRLENNHINRYVLRNIIDFTC